MPVCIKDWITHGYYSSAWSSLFPVVTLALTSSSYLSEGFLKLSYQACHQQQILSVPVSAVTQTGMASQQWILKLSLTGYYPFQISLMSTTA